MPLSIIYSRIEGTLQAVAECIMEVISAHTVDDLPASSSSYQILPFFRMYIMSVQVEMLMLRDFSGSEDKYKKFLVFASGQNLP